MKINLSIQHKSDTSYFIKRSDSRWPMGFVSTSGWPIPHHPIWDSIFPLWWFTAFRSPFFANKGPHIIHADYPVHEAVAHFFARRARCKGFILHIEAKNFYSGKADIAQGGQRSLAFGGGKDSRVLLGMLRSIGKEPAIFVYTGGLTRPHGLKNTVDYKVASDSQVCRMLPAMMGNPEELYIGCGSGEAEYMNPWQWCYEYSAYRPLQEMNQMFEYVGIQTKLKSPLSVSPYHINQAVLINEYPELYKYQDSAPNNSVTAKSMHVAMCEILHGGDPSQRCPKPLFDRLATIWVKQQLGLLPPTKWQAFAAELRALMYKMRNYPQVSVVKHLIPDIWKDNWINYIHEYMDPSIDPGMLEILHKYAPTIESAPSNTFRIPQ